MSAVEQATVETAHELGLRRMVTISESAAFLGVSHSTIKILIREGKVPSVKIGGSRRIPIDALLELARKGTE